MDLFDERVLAVLNDGKPRVFTQLLDEVGFSRSHVLDRRCAKSKNGKKKRQPAR